MCLRCVEDDAVCPECGTAPSEGPEELMSYHPWGGLDDMEGEEVQVQVVGEM
jgi:hypothetical protein